MGLPSSSPLLSQKLFNQPVLYLFLILSILSPLSISQELPECNDIPKVLCCTQRVIDKCLSGCLDFVTENCPERLEKFETIDTNLAGPSTREKTLPRSSSRSSSSSSPRSNSNSNQRRLAPQSGDYKLLNGDYPITEVSDKDLTSDCGTKRSRPPFSPCLSRKTVDELFLACCQQHVPANCHSLCSYEHREHVAAENLIQAIQQDGCDLSHLSKVLYCANQNRDNRDCCTHLGMSNQDLGVDDRCLRMCNIGLSGDRLQSIEKDDLVCLSNWNVIMYCARGGLRTIN